MKTPALVTSIVASLACFCAAPACRSEPLKTMDDVRAAIRTSVADPGRAARVIELTDELAELLDDTHSEKQRFEAEVRKLNVDYDATRSQFRNAFAEHDARFEELRRRCLDNRRKLVDATTPEEWDAVSTIRARAFALSADSENASK